MNRTALLRRLLASLALWTPFALLSAVQQGTVLQARGGPVSWPRVVLGQLVYFYFWALATPLVLWLGERFPVRRDRWLAPLALHLTTIAALASVHGWLVVMVDFRPGTPGAPPTTQAAWLQLMTRGTLFFDAFLYLCISLAGVALRARQKQRERELQVSRLEAQLAQARLLALEAQLHPHFVFNALNTVAMLIREHRNDVALRTLVAFGDLLRQILERDAPVVTLSGELESVRRYLEIESMRFADRLRVEVAAERDTLSVLVPSLVLQPLVENAIRHGAGAREGPFALTVRGRLAADRLVLEVEDDGPGLPPGWSLEGATGLGLRNTCARLREVYGDAARLEVRRREPHGVRVTLDLPARASLLAGPA